MERKIPKVDVWDYWTNKEDVYAVVLEIREHSEVLKLLWRKFNDSN